MSRYYEYGFADIELENRFQEPTYLDKINSIINWHKIEKIIRKYYKKDKNIVGTQAYPALRMFKILLVQRWENLSDPQMEFALRDRLSVIKFVGFPLSSPTPDHSTICRFRNNLLKTPAYEELLLEINSQLSDLGFMVKERKTTIVDATIVSSSSRPPCKPKVIEEDRKEKESNGLKESQEDIKTEEAQSSYKDSDAKWLKKGNKYYYGYKVFAATDEKGFILNCLAKPANVSEVTTFEEFLSKLDLPFDSNLLADKGYASLHNRKLLKAAGVNDFIMHKKTKGKELSSFLKELNKAISKVRFVIEQSFGLGKKHFKFYRFRYIGLPKVNMETLLFSMSFNMKKAADMMY